jgi:hypothetical protein
LASVRPAAWLHRAEVDRQTGLLHVRRRFIGRAVKAGGKTEGSARAIPMRTVVLGPLRIDTPILFPAPRGGYI